MAIIMNNTFKELFSSIQAGEELKDNTKAFLAEKTHNYNKAALVWHRYYVYVAACLCLLFVLFGGQWLYFNPTAEISIDINPSIELSINRFDQVISVNEFNEDGLDLSNAVDLKYKNYEEAIELILRHDSITALQSSDEIMIITVVGSDEQQAAKILSSVATCTASRNNTYCYFARSEDVAAAHDVGLSCGKYRAFLELQLLDPDVTPEVVQGMTMREIRELIESISADSDTTSYNRRGNGHYGQGVKHGNRWRSRNTGQQITEK